MAAKTLRVGCQGGKNDLFFTLYKPELFKLFGKIIIGNYKTEFIVLWKFVTSNFLNVYTLAFKVPTLSGNTQK